MKLCRCVLPLALALLIAGCSKEGRIESHLEKSRAFLAQGELDKASVEAKNVMQIDGNRAEPYLIEGRIAEERGNLRHAMGNYLKTIELEPANLEAKRRLARLYLMGGALDKASETADQVLAAAPDDADARTVKAALRAHKGDLDGAIADATGILSKQPGHADAAALLAGLYSSRMKDDRKAEAVIAQAVTVNPKNVSLRTVHVALAMKLGERDKAEADLKEIVAIEPQSFQHRATLARFYAATEQVDQAERVLREAVAAAPDDEDRHLALAELIAGRKGADAAEAELREAIEAHPKAYKLRFALAATLTAAGKRDAAVKVYEDIIALDKDGPSGLSAKLQLARAAFARGATEEGDRLVAEVIQANPKDGGALLLRGQRSLARNDTAGAIADLRAALKNDPGSVQINGLLAAAHRQNKEPELGRQVISSAVDLYPDRIDLRLLLAEYDLANNAPDRAMKELDEAIRRQPGDARPYVAKARLQAARKDSAGAERTLAALKQAQPNAALGYYQSGLLMSSQDKIEAAVKELKTSISKSPNSVQPRLALIGLLLREKRVNEAATAAQETVDAYPKAWLPRVMLGEVQVAQGKLDLAEASYKKAIELEPKAPLPRVHLARLYLGGYRDRQKAAETLEAAKQAIPGNRDILQVLAQLYTQSDQPDKAIAEYEALLKVNQRDDLAANNLAMLLLAKADAASMDRAKQLAERFESSQQPMFLDTLGWVHYARGDYDKALPILEKAVSLAPKAPELQFHLGMALYKTGKVDLAKQHLKQAIEAKVDFPGIDEARRIMAQG